MITKQRKESVYMDHITIINMIFKLGNSMMTRSQIKQLFSLITNEKQINIEFEIADLINSKFLLQKQIFGTKTQLLYLNKYILGRLLNKPSQNVAAMSFTNLKIFENIFKTEYIIKVIIPNMMEQNLKIDTDNIATYIRAIGGNFFKKPNQLYTFNYYQDFEFIAGQKYALTEEFYDDKKISLCEAELFKKNILKMEISEIPYLNEKSMRDSIKASYSSDIESNKQFYNFNNLMAQRFYIEEIENDCIKIVYFDTLNNLKLEKLYKNLIYIMLMFKKYLNNNINLDITVYMWDESRCSELLKAEKRSVFDVNTQENRDTNRRDTYFANLGIKREYWDDITVQYQVMDIAKYNIHI
ncbi:hypothetical protein [[Clostridium] fimetarium]|uniref:Uncharacterized protein n=1 Tax=[Clostridium] fimetarium TaxID=99656 RepID=A0A1I0QVJ0_9FIRM|nr:hypothetical protein [[Clostridium] fimetarium]SEW31704.1 hypothetical protein SAMN05421659_109174 [[Clostridium] fimetarium]